MKITASNSQIVQQKLDTISNVIEGTKSPKDQSIPSFSERLE